MYENVIFPLYGIKIVFGGVRLPRRRPSRHKRHLAVGFHHVDAAVGLLFDSPYVATIQQTRRDQPAHPWVRAPAYACKRLVTLSLGWHRSQSKSNRVSMTMTGPGDQVQRIMLRNDGACQWDASTFLENSNDSPHLPHLEVGSDYTVTRGERGWFRAMPSGSYSINLSHYLSHNSKSGELRGPHYYKPVQIEIKLTRT